VEPRWTTPGAHVHGAEAHDGSFGNGSVTGPQLSMSGELMTCRFDLWPVA